MSLLDRLRNPRLFWLGPLAGVLAWLVFLACSLLNPWWSITSLALSYLGASNARDYWLYNSGMMITGTLILLFSLHLFALARNRTQKFGSAHLTLAALLLVGIGIWHQGPGPYPPGTAAYGQDLHDLFSAWFFLQALLAGLTWGVGLRRERRFPVGLGMITSTMGAWVVAIVIAIAFGPLVGAAPAARPVLQLGGEVFLGIGIPLAGLGVALARFGERGSGRESWGIYLLMVGAILAGVGVIAGFGHIPGAVGEAIGVLAIDVWVFLMFFARDAQPWVAADLPPSGAMMPEERPALRSRRSLLHAFQVPAMGLVLTGMFLFFYGDFYLTQSLVGLILGTVKVTAIAGPVLALLLAGYLLVVLGAWRWSVVLPRWRGAALLALVISLPLVMLASWFDTSGNLALLLFFLVFALLAPLALSLHAWWRSRYVLTDRRVLDLPPFSARAVPSLPRSEVSGLAVRKGWFHRWFDVGDVTFLSLGGGAPGSTRGKAREVVWSGVAHPAEVLSGAERELHLSVVRSHRRSRRPWVLLLASLFVVPAVLVATVVPVFTVTQTVELPCAYLLGNLQATEENPWPYIHNLTLPVGHIHFDWYSGTGVWLIVGQLPVGLAYENANIGSNAQSLPTDLTSSGSGNYTSYGGSSFGVCISLASGAEVTLVFTYASPLVWA